MGRGVAGATSGVARKPPRPLGVAAHHSSKATLKSIWGGSKATPKPLGVAAWPPPGVGVACEPPLTPGVARRPLHFSYYFFLKKKLKFFCSLLFDFLVFF